MRDGATRSGVSSRTSARRTRRSSLIRYANDNRAVQAIHGFTTGPYKLVFYGLVVAAVLLGIYFPVRDLYIAHRTSGILNEQLAIRKAYNDALQKEVDAYLSTEGIEDTARRDFGMVKEGERPITVTGTDENGDPLIIVDDEDGEGDVAGGEPADDAAGDDAAEDDASKGGTASEKDKAPSTSAEVEEAERAVFQNSPWYYKMLDALFLFTGTEGQAVVSTGTAGAAGSAGSSEE